MDHLEETISSPASSRFPAHGIVLFTIAAIAIMTVYLFGPNLVEDSFISFRVAENLADGRGYVYNAGERVEATTNLLWVGLLAAAKSVGLPVPGTAAAAGVTAAILAAFVAYLILRKETTEPLAAIVTLLAIAPPSIWLLAVGGLETGLYSLLVGLTILCATSRWHFAAGLMGGLTFMARPEGAAILPAMLLGEMLQRRHERMPLSRAALALIPWALVIVGVTAARWTYFGSLLPNSVIAKSIPITQESLRLGVEYLRSAAIHLPFFVACVALAPAAGLRRPLVLSLLVISLLQVPVILRNAGDWMSYSRLLAQYFPVFIVLGGLVAHALLRGPGLFRQAGLLLLATSALLAPTMAERPAMRPVPGFTLGYPAWAYEALARRLAPAVRTDDLWAPEAIGMFGYTLRDQRIHDFLGLADRHIARAGMAYCLTYGKTDFLYTLNEHPTAIVFHSGDYHPRQIEAVAPGILDREYARFDLPDLANLRVYLRRDTVDRLSHCLPETAIRQN